MESALEWIKKSISICAKAGQISDEELKKELSTCEKEILDFSEETVNQIIKIMRKQFGVSDYIFVLSVLVKNMSTDIFLDELFEIVSMCQYKAWLGSMLELQLRFTKRWKYPQMRELHRKNVEQYKTEISGSYTYLPIEKRNKNRVVIVTEQILHPNHAPTRQVLNYAYAMHKALGYEVYIFSCPCDGYLSDDVWYGVEGMVSKDEYRNSMMEIEFRGIIFQGYQINMPKEHNKDYNMMFSIIHALNPIFVLSMGAFNPVLDVINSFTTVVAKAMNTGFPVSEADILLKVGREVKKKEDLEYIQNNTSQKILYIDKIATLFEDSDATFSRAQYNLPEDKFIMAVVGNRLNEEIGKEFVNVLNKILQDNSDIDVALIGNLEEITDAINELPKDRVILTGQVSDLMGVYKLVDLYINPKRGGGGHSSIMAMKSGVPIVTLPKCDVAYNAGEDFIVEDYSQYPGIVEKYFTDKEFYKSQKQKAIERASKNNEEALIRDIDKLVKDILETM